MVNHAPDFIGQSGPRQRAHKPDMNTPDRTETKPCGHCRNPMPVWKQQLRKEKRKPAGAMRWYRTGEFCSHECAEAAHKLTTTTITQRRTETKKCKNCLGDMLVWRQQPNGIWKKRGDFCSLNCRSEYNWNNPDNPFYRDMVIQGQAKHSEARGKRLSEWGRSEEGQSRMARLPSRSRSNPAKRTQKVADFATAMVAALQNNISSNDNVSVLPIEIDRRLIGQEGPEKRTKHRVIQLSDQRVFNSISQVAREVNRSAQAVSGAIRTGDRCQGHQYMLEEDWIALDKPEIHPTKKDQRIVRISDAKVFPNVNRAVIKIRGTTVATKIWDSIHKEVRYQETYFMRYPDWIIAGKPRSHPRPNRIDHRRVGQSGPAKRIQAPRNDRGQWVPQNKGS